jgi:hypothetical protein
VELPAVRSGRSQPGAQGQRSVSEQAVGEAGSARREARGACEAAAAAAARQAAIDRGADILKAGPAHVLCACLAAL